MTTRCRTGAVDFGMIHRYHRRPSRGAVTRFANVGRIDVTVGQTVATGTGTSAVDFGMIHRNDRRPGIGGMTGFANVSGVDVAVR